MQDPNLLPSWSPFLERSVFSRLYNDEVFYWDFLVTSSYPGSKIWPFLLPYLTLSQYHCYSPYKIYELSTFIFKIQCNSRILRKFTSLGWKINRKVFNHDNCASKTSFTMVAKFCSWVQVIFPSNMHVDVRDKYVDMHYNYVNIRDIHMYYNIVYTSLVNMQRNLFISLICNYYF